MSYDVPHHAPWGWRVSLYTWTKGIAAGGLLVPLILILAGQLSWGSPLARWAAPVVALAFLGATGILLIWDLRHPARFYLIFTRPQWRSWLVRGSFIIGGYGGAAALYLLGSLAGSVVLRQVAAGLVLPLAIATACYTAYLFAQAKARDLWQSPLLAPHLAVQAVLAGAAAILPFAAWLGPAGALRAAEVLLAGAAAAHVLLVLGEITRHPSDRARAPGRGGDDLRPLRSVFLAGPGRGHRRGHGAVDRRGRRPARAGRAAGPRARLRPGRPVGPARVRS